MKCRILGNLSSVFFWLLSNQLLGIELSDSLSAAHLVTSIFRLQFTCALCFVRIGLTNVRY